MYDYEIRALLQENNNVITKEQYAKICDSPQINFVKFNPYSNSFELATESGMFVNFRVE